MSIVRPQNVLCTTFCLILAISRVVPGQPPATQPKGTAIHSVEAVVNEKQYRYVLTSKPMLPTQRFPEGFYLRELDRVDPDGGASKTLLREILDGDRLNGDITDVLVGAQGEVYLLRTSAESFVLFRVPFDADPKPEAQCDSYALADVKRRIDPATGDAVKDVNNPNAEILGGSHDLGIKLNWTVAATLSRTPNGFSVHLRELGQPGAQPVFRFTYDVARRKWQREPSDEKKP